MKKFALAAIAALIVVPCLALSQGGPPTGGPPQGGPPRGGMMMGGDFMKRMAQRQKEMRDRLVKELKFTPAQTKAYDALSKKENDSRMKLFKPGGPRPDRTVFDKMRLDHDTAMKKILTKDQFAKYTKIQEEERKKRMQRMGGPGGPTGISGGGKGI